MNKTNTPTFCIVTLGCKVNKTDSLSIRQMLISDGFREVPFEYGADVYIVNTCTVTAKSDFQSRQLARRAFRQNNRAKILITGCYAQTNPQDLKKLPGEIIILNNQEKLEIGKHLRSLITDSSVQPPSNLITAESYSSKYTRAFLKIQDGCNWNCTYCIVPQARGRSVSYPKSDVIRQAKDLILQGYNEIVITGIHIGHYGLDLSPKTNLADLLKDLIALPGLGRIRLSSLEPVEFTEQLINIVAETDKICWHFHIPLQSADDNILKLMGRNYSFEKYRELMLKLREIFPGAALGCDVIVGFPGETEAFFENTYQRIAQLPLTYLHVFSYSKRLGTKAANMPNQVPENEKKSRSQKLRDLSELKKLNFYQSQLKQIRPSLVLNQYRKSEKYLVALSDNYINVLIKPDEKLINQIVPLELTEITDNTVFGTIIS